MVYLYLFGALRASNLEGFRYLEPSNLAIGYRGHNNHPVRGVQGPQFFKILGPSNLAVAFQGPKSLQIASICDKDLFYSPTSPSNFVSFFQNTTKNFVRSTS